jgi:hypothetical protein
MNKHFELEIKTLQNAPKDEEKLKALLKARGDPWARTPAYHN